MINYITIYKSDYNFKASFQEHTGVIKDFYSIHSLISFLKNVNLNDTVYLKIFKNNNLFKNLTFYKSSQYLILEELYKLI